ncbi:MAG TPA: alpha-E domain-containing protein [Polyangiaceae bacterium]|nr:alpha-E domain-containing protein [Polyangiaceae bacterium]
MLSRVAESIYWSARYVERAENLARCIDVNLQLMLDAPAQQRGGWDSLVMTTGDQSWFEAHYGKPTQEAVIQFLTFDADYPNSILASISKARENARTVREIISREMWQELNEFYLMVVHAARPKVSPEELSEFCDRVKRMGIYFEGVTSATLSRGEAWHFAQLGRMLERADKTSRILDVKYFLLLPPGNGVGSTFDQLGWTTLLNSASALQMYRQHYHVTTPASVAKFLLLDRNFPRSIQHCIVTAQQCLHALTASPIGTYRNDAERFIGQLRATLDYAEIEQIMSAGLHEYVDGIQAGCNNVGVAIQRQFFQI